MLLHRPQYRLGVEPRQHDHRRARQQQPHGGQRARVVERSDHQMRAEPGEGVVPEAAQELCNRARRGEGVGWLLDRFRPPRGSRGEHQRRSGPHGRRVVIRRGSRNELLPRLHRPVGLHRLDGLDRRRTLLGVSAVEAPAQHPDRPGRRRGGPLSDLGGLRADEHDPRLRDVQEVDDLVRGQVEADRHRRQPGQHDRGVRQHRLDGVVSHDGNPTCGLRVQPAQGGDGGPEPPVELLPVQCDEVVRQRGCRAPALRELIDDRT